MVPTGPSSQRISARRRLPLNHTTQLTPGLLRPQFPLQPLSSSRCTITAEPPAGIPLSTPSGLEGLETVPSADGARKGATGAGNGILDGMGDMQGLLDADDDDGLGGS